MANETGAQIQHTDNNGAATPAWPTVACYLIEKCLNEKTETKEQEASTQSENDAKDAATPLAAACPTEDEIKPDTASASSSARSSADTSDARD